MVASTPVVPLWAARVVRFSLPPLLVVAAVVGIWHFDRTGQHGARDSTYLGVVGLWPLALFVFALLQGREKIWGGYSGRRLVQFAVGRAVLYAWLSSLPVTMLVLPVLHIAGHRFGYRVMLGYVAVGVVTLFGTVLLLQRVPGSGDGYPSNPTSWL